MGAGGNDTGMMDRIRDALARRLRRWRFLRSIRHLHGPREGQAGPQDVTVVTLVKDGAYYLDAFFDHYRKMGIRHFVFFDNGSSDGTLDRIAAEPGTIIVQSTLPPGAYENDFRRYAAERFCRNRWCLFSDVDELFDFDGRDRIGILGLITYLERNGFTALIAQMLDMFPDMPLRDAQDLSYGEALVAYRYYDLDRITPVPYDDSTVLTFHYYLAQNTLANDRITFLMGGVRKRVFDENCLLTKHPLVFVGDGVEPGVHPHCSAHVHCADFTALIRHYKFTDDPMGRDARNVAHEVYSHGEDHQRLREWDRDPDLTLWRPEAQVFNGFDALCEAGFLMRSPRFAAFCAAQADRSDA